MRCKSIVLVLAVLVLGCLIPLSSEEADAIDREDFEIVVPGHDLHTTIPTPIGNGESYTWTIYVINKSSHVLDVQFRSSSDSSKVVCSELEGITLKAYRDGGSEVVTSLDFTVSVDELAPTMRGVNVFVYASVSDIDDSTFTVVPISFPVSVTSNFNIEGNFNKFFGFIDNTLPEPLDSPVVPFLVTLIVLILAVYAVVKLAVPAMGMLFERELDKVSRKKTENLLAFSIIVIALVLYIDPGLRILGADVEAVIMAEDLAISLLIVMAAIAIWVTYITVVRLLLNHISGKKNDEWVLSLIPLFSLIGKLVLTIASVAAIMNVYGFDLGEILVSAGFVSLGITLGARQVLAQLFGGVIIIATRRFNSGDMVMIRRRRYRVKAVRLMYTELETLMDRRMVTIPNSTMAKVTVVDTGNFRRRTRFEIFVTVPYGCDLRKVEEIMLEVTKDFENIVQGPEDGPKVELSDFGDIGIKMSISILFHRWVDFSMLKKEIYVRLAEEGIEIPLKRLELRIIGKETEGGQTT